MSQDLKDKVAIVTGGTQGIGLEIAKLFAIHGAQVLISGRTQDKAITVAEQISKENNANVAGIQADVAKSSDVEAMVNMALDKFKRIDILVNNAGITRDNLLLRMTEQDFDEVVATNLKGAFLCCKAVCRTMLKQRQGSMINISSVVGLSGNAGQANYAATKAGLIGLTKSLAKELASRTIRVNAIAPGFIRTAMTDDLSEEARKALLDQIPLGRFGEGSEIAEVALFLGSDRSRYVTGQVLRIDGGMMM